MGVMKGWTAAAALGLMVAAAAAAVPATADVKAGVDAWSRGDYRRAVEEWRGPAVAGDADAQFNLGQAYKLGRGVPVDLAMAESWYRRAALQGHVQAEDNYGLALFQNGKRSEAAPWLEKSAARGEPRAQYVLGTMLFNGDGVRKDWVRAYALTMRASQAGLPQASQALAQMDRYVPIADRRQGLELARQYESDAARPQFPTEVAQTSTRPAGPIRTSDLPPSAASAEADQDYPPIATQPPRLTRGPGRDLPLSAPVYADAGRSPPRGAYPAPNSYPPQPAYPQQGGYADQRDDDAPPPEQPYPDQRPDPQPRPYPQARPEPTRAPVRTPVRPAAGGGVWRAQFGAFRDRGNADALWRQLRGRVGLLSGLQPYMVRAGSLTKLQAGPLASAADAARLCRAVRATGNVCVVTRR